MKLYIYKVVREDWNGNRGRRTKKLIRFETDLTVGNLYMHLGSGFPGMQRVLSVDTEEIQD